MVDAQELASKITEAGSAKVQQQKPPAVDAAVVNKVIKQGAAALSRDAGKGKEDSAIGAAAVVSATLTACRACTRACPHCRQSGNLCVRERDI